jgi:undecaprenyl-diphosphatase
MDRMLTRFQKVDDFLFYRINGSKQLYRSFFSYVTHLGGARFTVGSVLILYFLSQYYPQMQTTVMAAMITLCISHIIMSITKRLVKRIRPYLTLPDARIHG